MKSRNLKRIVFLVFLFILSIVLYSCQKQEDPDDDDDDPIENNITHTSYSILEDTLYETEVHVFKSSIEGPVIMVVGGIHGDELAGWHAGTSLLSKDNFIGTVIVIPKANILADQLEQRYPGINDNGLYNGITYDDLNRNFPGDEEGTVTEQIAYAIISEVTKYNPKYVIDLHESRSSYADSSNPKLGDLLLYGNGKSALLSYDIVEEYNKTYLLEDEVEFAVDGPSVAGGFNYYCASLGMYAITIETNRKLDLNRRIEQQLDLLDIMFEIIWNQ